MGFFESLSSLGRKGMTEEDILAFNVKLVAAKNGVDESEVSWVKHGNKTVFRITKAALESQEQQFWEQLQQPSVLPERTYPKGYQPLRTTCSCGQTYHGINALGQTYHGTNALGQTDHGTNALENTSTGTSKAIKVKGGYVVVHKLTGKVLHKFKGEGAKEKAEAVVSASNSLPY